ncbi:hypothetical protein PCH_Pc20g07950 [Penicillium rubens Wisconsin 54-1255]|uniref:Uncharacterized protein n=1 Tax=Penicillium rubens (strain ATCC 28089 / DSM 1075 / NRRL 1951 / Wisconsin 54-1255) TaxID=500485 RepID=B6HEM7_PENRW|nr:hypothetical protein PCH_Pc20g07950 [Penicillium rubens Wisconsin 54-1255]
MAGGVQMGPCQVIAGSQCGFLLADGASVLDSLSEVQEPIDVKWASCLLVPLVWTWVDVLTATGVESYNIETSGARGHQYLRIKYTKYIRWAEVHLATVDPIRAFKVRRG